MVGEAEAERHEVLMERELEEPMEHEAVPEGVVAPEAGGGSCGYGHVAKRRTVYTTDVVIFRARGTCGTFP